MKIRICIILLFSLAWRAAAAAGLEFDGLGKAAIEIAPEANTGLNAIYVLPETDGIVASYTAKNASATVNWLKFGSYGGAHAEQVDVQKSGKVTTCALEADDCGFIIEEGTDRYYCWIVNYANHRADLRGITIGEEQDCDRTRLGLEGNASRITYYTINGQGRELSRELEIEYYTLEYNPENELYDQVTAHQTIASVDGSFSVPAPYCDTQFSISGDRFLRAWGEEEHAASPFFHTNAVDAHTTATQEGRENPNEQAVETEGLGGSAPVVINFSAAVTDAAIFREWQLSRDPEFETVDDRYQQLEFDYIFRDNGTVYVRFIADNAQGSCQFDGEVYTVFIGESALLCPNAFSPGASEGVNDEWKVSYKSIISFDCHIFNRWGQELAHLTDPSQGWDGRYHGKLVPTGAYYYVIKAEGSDGKKYNLSGDINIIRARNNNNTTGGGSDEGPLE